MYSPTRATSDERTFTSLEHGVHNWFDDHNLQDWPDNWRMVHGISNITVDIRSKSWSTDTALIWKVTFRTAMGTINRYEHCWRTLTKDQNITRFLEAQSN